VMVMNVNDKIDILREIQGLESKIHTTTPPPGMSAIETDIRWIKDSIVEIKDDIREYKKSQDEAKSRTTLQWIGIVASFIVAFLLKFIKFG
jgi:50S ribosomal subunit-associated GTPase HflX